MKRILFLLHSNPPIHGSAVIGNSIRESEVINNKFECLFVNLLISKSVNETSKITLFKIIRYIQIIIKTLYFILFKRPDVCYLALTCSGAAFYKDVILVFMLKSFRIKIIYHLHNKGFSIESKKIRYDLLYQYVFKNTEVIILSKLLYTDIKKYVTFDKTYICPNGIKSTRTNFETKKISDSKKIEILFLSNLISSKGIFVLLEACKLLKVKKHNFNCTIIGADGDVKLNDFVREVEEAGLKNEISVVGKKIGNEKISFFEKADIFVFPTFYHNETFGLVNIEAMQFSLPIISTFEGGIPDVVIDNFNGFLINQRDPDALAEKIEKLILNPELRITFGERGRNLFVNEFTFDIFENRLVEILSNTLQKNKQKKILFLSPLPPPFYGSAISSEMCLNLLRSKKEYSIINIKLNYSLEFNDMEKFNIRKIIGFFRVVFLILKHGLFFKPDLIYIMPATSGISFYRDSTFALIIRLFSANKLFHLRTQIPDFKDKKIKNKIFRLSTYKSNVIILGNELKPEISEYFPNNKIYILPNAIVESINDIEFQEIMDFRLKNKCLNLTFISNMLKSKGWEIVLETAKILSDMNLEFKIRFAGSWPSNVEKLEFHNFVKNNMLEKYIEHKGYVNTEQKHKLLRETDILLFPTNYKLETFGRVIIEAMEFGIPVIANGIATIPSIINHNVSGYILKENTAIEIVTYIKTLNNLSLRLQMGVKARERFKENYTISTYKEGLINIISKC